MKLSKRYAITNVTLIDGVHDEPQDNMVLVINGNAVEKICKTADFKAEADMQTVDMSGKCIIPGLIDSHIHLVGQPEMMTYLGKCSPYWTGAESLAQAQRMLKYGFTACRDISTSGLFLKRIINAGAVVGPRIVACGPGLDRSGGHPSISFYPEMTVPENNATHIVADGSEECRKAVRKLISMGADQIKFWATGGNFGTMDRTSNEHYTLEEMKTIVQESKMFEGTKVLAHTENAKTTLDCIEAGVDTIEHGDFSNEECFEKMIKKGIYMVPTLSLITTFYEEAPVMPEDPYNMLLQREMLPNPPSFEEFRKEEIQAVIDNFKMAHEMGVKLAVGSDALTTMDTPYGLYSAREVCCMAQHGMSNMEALVAATRVNSEVLGMEQAIGTLEPGKFADFVIMEKSPADEIKVLLDSENVEYVFINGRIAMNHGCLTVN